MAAEREDLRRVATGRREDLGRLVHVGLERDGGLRRVQQFDVDLLAPPDGAVVDPVVAGAVERRERLPVTRREGGGVAPHELDARVARVDTRGQADRIELRHHLRVPRQERFLVVVLEQLGPYEQAVTERADRAVGERDRPAVAEMTGELGGRCGDVVARGEDAARPPHVGRKLAAPDERLDVPVEVHDAAALRPPVDHLVVRSGQLAHALHVVLVHGPCPLGEHLHDRRVGGLQLVEPGEHGALVVRVEQLDADEDALPLDHDLGVLNDNGPAAAHRIAAHLRHECGPVLARGERPDRVPAVLGHEFLSRPERGDELLAGHVGPVRRVVDHVEVGREQRAGVIPAASVQARHELALQALGR